MSNSKNIKQGNEYFKNNDFVSAADCYAKVNKLSGNYSYYRYLIDEIDQSSDTYSQAKSAVDDKDYITALTISQNAIKDYPHMTVFLDIITEAEDGLSSDITTLYNSGNYAEAYKDINALDESLVNSDIENIKNLILGTIDGKINSAQSSFDSGDYTTAEAAANYVLDIEPDNETAKSIIASISAKRSAKETYISKLKNTIQGIGCSYSIYDINKDGISDVVFRTQADTTPGQKTATFALYVYENGNFNKIGSVSTDGNDLYASKKNGVYVISSDPCWEEYIKYEYRNGSLVRNQSEEVFVGIETFSVDGKPASKQVAENNARIIEGNAMTFTASSNLSAADSATFTE
jgi:tetratricopeptide (TPR) repeat protein